MLITESYANLARSDAARFGMDRGVVAAIRLSSVRTGVEFSYLMKLAATESNFEPGIKSPTSSATGIYQFTHDTWLNAIKAHGASYGLADYAQAIEYYVTRSGYQRPMVADDALYRHLLQLRKNPRLAAMMAAESVRDNQRRLVKLKDVHPHVQQVRRHQEEEVQGVALQGLGVLGQQADLLGHLRHLDAQRPLGRPGAGQGVNAP